MRFMTPEGKVIEVLICTSTGAALARARQRLIERDGLRPLDPMPKWALRDMQRQGDDRAAGA